ncbi:MAG: ABC transporter ATP-binding protein [Planctomycetota bacterium]|nr:ABC transporter ATP-binding protein [Planctomycetota bacterium]
MSLELQQLKKQYRAPDGSVVPVIDVESLYIGGGEQVALIGSSGSGKTTLLHLIAGILAADSGRVLYDFGEGSGPGAARMPADGVLSYKVPGGVVNLAELSEAARDVFRGRNVGYIFQTHHLLSGFTALENVLLGMSFTGRKHDREWARHLLEQVGLSQRLDYRPQKLSLGQQQRVAVARALANRPKLVLADEPTGSLDAGNAQQVLKLVRGLCEEVGAMLLVVSHDPAITGQFGKVLRLADINQAKQPANLHPQLT